MFPPFDIHNRTFARSNIPEELTQASSNLIFVSKFIGLVHKIQYPPKYVNQFKKTHAEMGIEEQIRKGLGTVNELACSIGLLLPDQQIYTLTIKGPYENKIISKPVKSRGFRARYVRANPVDLKPEDLYVISMYYSEYVRHLAERKGYDFQLPFEATRLFANRLRDNPLRHPGLNLFSRR